MQFRKPEIKDVEKIKRQIEETGYKSCQLSAASIYCYEKKYGTQICFEDGFLFIRQNREPFGICYFMPIGAGDLANALDKLAAHDKSAVIWGIADDMKQDFENALSGRQSIELTPDRDWAEYIHSAENLINMQGKRFHAKKNAVNQFLRNNSDFGYEPITKENIDEVAAFQSKHLCGVKKFETDMNMVNNLIEENTAIMLGLKNFDALELMGGIIRIDGDVCAYAFGGAINSKVFDLTFEKALRNYNGIFQVLEREMIKNNLSSFEFINREEDLGVPGLRFSKEKLRPDVLLMKYRAERLEPKMRG